MKRIIVLFSLLFVAHTICAQQIFFTPIIGGKIEVSRGQGNDYEPPDFFVIKDTRPTLSPMNTVLFGFKFNYIKNNRHDFNIGVIFNDRAYSKVKYNFYALVNNEEVFIEKNIYSGIKLLKVPISYNYKAWWNKKENFSFSFHTGLNLLISQKWNGFTKEIIPTESYILTQDVPSGGKLTIDNNAYNLSYQTGKRVNLSLDFGFNLAFKLNDKRKMITSLYYEQGLKRYISATYTTISYENEQPFNITNASAGSSLHFKILFPISIK